MASSSCLSCGTPRLLRGRPPRAAASLIEELERLLADDPTCQQLRMRILRVQFLLEQAVDPEVWRIYLELEELVNRRSVYSHAMLAHLATTSGLRGCPREFGARPSSTGIDS